MNLILKLVPNPDCDSVNCSICGSTFHSALRDVLAGSGSDHAVCHHCFTLPQAEMLKGATEYLKFLDAWKFVQGQLCQWLEHAELERPTKGAIDVAFFNAQLEQGEAGDE